MPLWHALPWWSQAWYIKKKANQGSRGMAPTGTGQRGPKGHCFLWMGTEIWTLLSGRQIRVIRVQRRRSPSAEFWDDPLPVVPCQLYVALPPHSRRACLSPWAWLSCFCCQHCTSSTGQEENPIWLHAALVTPVPKNQLCPHLLSFGGWVGAMCPSERGCLS